MVKQSLLTLTLTGGLFAGALSVDARAQSLSVELVASGLSQIVYVTQAPGETDRLFVLQQNGRVRIIEDGVLLGTPFIDVSGAVSCCGERGLLGMAFHPDYQVNGRFFLSYTAPAGNSRVREYSATPPSSNVANPASVQTIFAQSQPFSNHNGGCIKFRPGDGSRLYIGMGDGGSANDPQGNGQDPTTNLGKLIRLDVDLPSPFIPADNPFVGVGGTNDEIWALGMRNPWRFSFDQANGDLYIGDVGQFAIEEIDYVDYSLNSGGGQNYGWRCMEGNNCTGLSGCTCNAPSLTDPIHQYSHTGGSCSVTGGYVYRGPCNELQGTYFFGDYCSSRMWSFKVVGGSVTQFTDRTAALSGPIGLISSFGQDNSGEVYICDYQDGQLWKIVHDDCDLGSRYCAAVPNSTGQTGVMTVTGSADVDDDSLLLTASSLPLNSNIGYFIMGMGMNTFTPPGSAGPICIAPGIKRYLPPVSNTNEGPGGFVRDVGTMGSVSGQISAGSTWNFQAWHRDSMAGTSNLTDAVSVSFLP